MYLQVLFTLICFYCGECISCETKVLWPPLSLRSTCASRYERASSSSNASTWLWCSPPSSFWIPERTSNAPTAPQCPTPRSYESTNATVIHLQLLNQAFLYILRPTQVCDSESNLTTCCCWVFCCFCCFFCTDEDL